jgi:DNA topoisomerase IB
VARLRRSDPAQPGWTRRRSGRGFTYLDENGRRLADDQRERCAALAIPPAWAQVWICPWPHGHLQAVGTDDAGRRQYLYHPAWRERRDREKFDRVLAFGRSLPAARDQVSRELARAGMPRAKALAVAFRLLDLAGLRVGGESYAESSGAVGVATLRRDHVRTRGDRVLLRFTGKSGVQHDLELVDPVLADAVRTLRRRRAAGEELLAWREGRAWRDITSTDVNAYVAEVTGTGATAKDFRTWQGTVRALAALADQPAPDSDGERRRAVAAAMRAAAEHLGNTPAVARSAYVDPRVVETFLDGEPLLDPRNVQIASADDVGDDADDDDGDVAPGDDWLRWEAAVLALLTPDTAAVDA